MGQTDVVSGDLVDHLRVDIRVNALAMMGGEWGEMVVRVRRQVVTDRAMNCS